MGRHRAPDDEPEEPGAEAPGFGAEGDESADDTTVFRRPANWSSPPDDPSTQTFAVPRRSGAAHGGDWDGGEWTGSHRAIQPGRRGVSVGVVVALIAVVVVVGAVILWRFFGATLSDRSREASARCVSGSVDVAVLADPTIADQISALAGRYNQRAEPIGDKCVKIAVKPADPDDVVTGLAGKWPNELGPRPALWVPASSLSAARLEAAAGAQAVSGGSKSLATSPVVLAVRPQLKDALAQQNWGTIPALQTTPAALDGLSLPGWGSLRLAVPTIGNGDAGYLAGEAIATAAAAGGPANTGTGAVRKVMHAQPKLPDQKAATAFDALTSADDAATAPVHAVATTEQQVYQRSQHIDGAKTKLAAWLPPGAPAVADYPAVLIGGDRSHEESTAASEFERFLRKPEQLAELAKAGFRTAGGEAPKNDVVNIGSLPDPLSTGDADTRAAVANAVSGTGQAAAVTIMLDQSMPNDEGGKSRLANTTAALTDRLKAMSPSSSVGLWTFDGVAGRSEVPMAPLSETAGGQSHAAQLGSELQSQNASGGGAVSFTTLRLLYGDSVSNFRDGQANSILVITTGPHTDQSLDGSGLQDYLKAAVDQARPVAINVIDFGTDPDGATWEAASRITGGTYTKLASSAGPELAAALAAALP